MVDQILITQAKVTQLWQIQHQFAPGILQTVQLVTATNNIFCPRKTACCCWRLLKYLKMKQDNSRLQNTWNVDFWTNRDETAWCFSYFFSRLLHLLLLWRAAFPPGMSLLSLCCLKWNLQEGSVWAFACKRQLLPFGCTLSKVLHSGLQPRLCFTLVVLDLQTNLGKIRSHYANYFCIQYPPQKL